MSHLLVKRFEEMGARVKVSTAQPPRFRRFSTNQATVPGIPRLDVRSDNKGEFFDIQFPFNAEPAQVDVVDIKPDDRHLLLLVKSEGERGQINKSKFLCGHDERHWFVAAIPEKATGVGDVRRAKEALQPPAVKEALAHSGLKPNEQLKRKNEVYHRQGEWFFMPVADLHPAKDLIRKNEPLSRGAGSKPHTMEFCYRAGGETVYVSRQYPNGIPGKTYQALPEKERKAIGWRVMVRDANVYAKGKISHADHATIVLPTWCRVLMNTENQAAAMRHVAFLD
jgi:hypothetical protein